MYVTQSPDTTKEAELYQFGLLRQAGAAKRLAISKKLTRQGRFLCLKGIQSREKNPEVVQKKFAKAVGCQSLEFSAWSSEMEWIQDSGKLAERLHLIFEQEHISYYVTGGVSSSIHGDPRFTRDLDVVVQVSSFALDRLVFTLEANGFYVPHNAVNEVKRGVGQSINIVDSSTIESVDIIISSDTPFDRSQMTRRQKIEGIDFYICSAEDCILQKLKWRQRSLSEKQWTDVLGIIKIQMDSLDFDYLKNWASNLGISEDLERAIESSRSDEN